jgi:hypothetical protein
MTAQFRLRTFSWSRQLVVVPERLDQLNPSRKASMALERQVVVAIG